MVTEKVEEHGCESESYNGMGIPLAFFVMRTLLSGGAHAGICSSLFDR